MKSKMRMLVLVSCLAGCFVWSAAFAAQQMTNQAQTSPPAATESVKPDRVKPVGTMRAPEPLALTCAKLSAQINADKDQLRSVLGYLNSYGCSSEPAASSAQCVELNNKKAALEARIEANQQKARDKGCT